MKHISPIFFFFCIFFLGCDKKGGSIYDCVLSPEFLEGGYRVTNVSRNGLEIFYNEQYYPICKRDDLLVFFSNTTENSGEYNRVEGSNKCTPETYEEGVWTLTGDTLMLDQAAFKVLDFTCIGFKTELRIPDPVNPGLQLIYITNFAKVY